MTTFGLLLPTLAPPGKELDVDAPVEVACWAEDAGFEHVWVGDHIVHPNQFLESIVVLSIVAARTTRIRLGPAVLQLPMRQLAVAAKQISTLAVMSHDRLSLGVGLGGEYPYEWEAAGVPLSERGARLTEHVRLLKALSSGEPIDETGRFTRLPGIAMQPSPSSMPILFGARSAPALRRTAELGDGWIGFMHSPSGYRGMVGELDRLREEVGRGDVPFRRAMLVSFRVDQPSGPRASQSDDKMAVLDQKMSKYLASGSADQIATRLNEYVAAGCDHLIMVPFVEGAYGRDDLEVLRAEIIPNVD